MAWSTRERILVEGASVIRRLGYERATLALVAGAIETTRPAIYYYFACKEDLLWELFQDGMRALEESVSLAQSMQGGDALRAVLEKHVERMIRYPDVSAVVLREARHLNSERRHEVAERSRNYIHEIARLIARDSPPGSAGRDNALRLANVAIACLNSELISGLPNQEQGPSEATTMWLVEWLLGAIRSRDPSTETEGSKEYERDAPSV